MMLYCPGKGKKRAVSGDFLGVFDTVFGPPARGF
jgi:hypothetical protein